MEQALPTASLGTFAIWGTQISVRHAGAPGCVEVDVLLRVADVSTGASTHVRTRSVYTMPLEESPPGLFAAFVRSCVQAAVNHEVDEWLRVNGDLVTEPHPEERKRTV